MNSGENWADCGELKSSQCNARPVRKVFVDADVGKSWTLVPWVHIWPAANCPLIEPNRFSLRFHHLAKPVIAISARFSFEAARQASCRSRNNVTGSRRPALTS
jgi:hypothetical protein